MDLLAELKNLTLKLNQAGIEYALCGGLALAVYDKPRATLDIDMLVTPETNQAWVSRRTINWGGGKLTVVSPAGLILLKSLRGSGQDADDIEYLRSISDED